MRSKISEAIRLDLGREAFATWFYELALVEHDCEHVLRHLKRWSQPVEINTAMLVGPAKSKLLYEPLGVVAVMGSWNFPVYTTLAPLIYVIAAGNTALIKPSEIAPNSLFVIKELCKAYLDPYSYICIEGQIKVAQYIPTRKFDGLCFTGSPEKGKMVAQAAAQNLIPCVLELGGKCPFIVDSDADIEFAAKKVAFSKFGNAGQTCIAPDYVIV